MAARPTDARPTRSTAAELAALLDGRRGLAPSRSRRRTWTASRPSTAPTARRARVPARRRATRALAAARRRRRRARGRRAARPRWPACRSRSRTSWPPRACRPPPGRGSSRAGCRRTTRRWSARIREARLVDPRQDEHGRVRDGLVHRALRPTAPTRNPWDLDAHPRRFRRRLVGGARGVRGAAGDRHRHRRLDPAAGRRHRHGRRQADLRRRLALRPGRAGVSSLDQAGPCARTVLDAALLHEVIGGPRPDGLHQPRPTPVPAFAAAARPAPATRRGPAGRRRHASSPARATRPASGPGSTRRSSCSTEAGAEVVEVSCPSFTARARGVLPDPAERGEQQPRQVRRDALRPAGRPRRASSADRRAGHGRDPRGRASATRSSGASSSARTRCRRGYYDAYYG